MSIAIVHDQEIVWARGYGYADLESRTPATPSTVYRLGSVSKLFTATAIMLLRDEGKLRLDDPITEYLPWFRLANDFPDAPPITVRHLLTHTSGLPREADVPYWTDHVFPTREQLIAVVPTQEAIAPPETTYHYSNLGMALLGEIVAQVSGRPWHRFVKDEILDPLGMTSSSGAPSDELLARRATPYMLMGPDGSRQVFDYYDAGAIGPAANMVSTVEDLGRFASLQFHDGPAGGDRILRGSTLREMHRVHWLYSSFSGGRGLGFSVYRGDGVTFVGHGGWIGGNRSYFLTVPSQRIAVIAILNADDRGPYFMCKQAYEAVAPALLQQVKRQAAEQAADTPAERTTGPDPAWQSYVGRYSDPWGWEYEVMILGDELVMYGYDFPPDDEALSGYTTLTLVEGRTFRMPDNETVTFEVDDSGAVTRIKRRNDYIFPVEESPATPSRSSAASRRSN
jgi:CubicO group peptidase (beta-lactamase class C family)